MSRSTYEGRGTAHQNICPIPTQNGNPVMGSAEICHVENFPTHLSRRREAFNPCSQLLTAALPERDNAFSLIP